MGGVLALAPFVSSFGRIYWLTFISNSVFVIHFNFGMVFMIYFGGIWWTVKNKKITVIFLLVFVGNVTYLCIQTSICSYCTIAISKQWKDFDGFKES